MREVVLGAAGSSHGYGSSRETFTHQGVASFDLQLLENVNHNSVHLIIEQKSYEIAANEQMVSHLTEIFEKQVTADVKFVVKSQPIGAHLNVVVPFSPVMAAMLDNDRFQEGLTKTVHIDDMEPDVFKEMLRYLYTGKVPQLEQMTESLFVAADRFQIQGLKDLCAEQLIQQLDLNNAVRYLVLGHLHSVPQLLEASLQCLEKNKKKLWSRTDWENFAQSYPELFYQVTGRLMK